MSDPETHLQPVPAAWMLLMRPPLPLIYCHSTTIYVFICVNCQTHTKKMFIFLFFVKILQINSEEKTPCVLWDVCLCGFDLPGWSGRGLIPASTLVLAPWTVDRSHLSECVL